MEKIFTNSTILEESKNWLHVFEILLVTLFINGKVEQDFLRMNMIKTDWQDRLGQKRLGNLMIISREGPSVEDFNPDHASNAWYRVKCDELEVRHDKYPAKRARTNTGTIDLVTVTLCDLENDTDRW